MDTKIISLKLKVKDIEIELTLDEARELMGELQKTFNQVVAFVPIREYVPYPVYPAPALIGISPTPWPYTPTYTCLSGNTESRFAGMLSC